MHAKEIVNGYKNKKYITSNIYLDVFIAYIYIVIGIFLAIVSKNNFVYTSFFYISVIIGAVFFAALSQKSNSKSLSKFFYFTSFLILFFVMGFRNASGIDDISYVRIFREIAQNGWIYRFKTTLMEPGYLLINYIVSRFTDSYLYIQIVTSFIPLSLFYYGFTKYKNYISIPMAVFLLSTTLYFQVLSVALIRIFIAVSIVFVSFGFIINKKPIRFVVAIFIAGMFHYSAFFMLVLSYFTVRQKKLTAKAKKFTFLGFILTPILFYFISNYVVPLLGGRYSGYGEIGTFSFNHILSTLSIIPIIALLIYFRSVIPKEDRGVYYSLIAVYSLSFIIPFYGSLVSFGRLIYYSDLSLLILAPMVGRRLKGSTVKRLFFYGIIIAYGFLVLYRTQFAFSGNVPYLFPYENWFFSIE